MQKIENIIFDLGGVLLDIDYHLTRKAFEQSGIINFNEMYSQANADQLFQKLETGKISEDDFHNELNNCAGLSLSPQEINSAWNAMLLSFREESLQCLDQIKSKYQLFLLSNTNFIHMDAFKKIYHTKKREKEFDEYFNKAFYSCDIGLRKPDLVCYEWVLSDLNIKPGATLFIDDSAQNIEAAQLAGLQTYHLTPGKKVEDFFR
ncbi:MAG: HAD family phosphatase [Bacteroidota bacterium]|nr:HAD family phosphatase [Bacteroidota bacterium]